LISTKNSGGGRVVGGTGSPQSVVRSLRFLKAKIGAVIEPFQSVRGLRGVEKSNEPKIAGFQIAVWGEF